MGRRRGVLDEIYITRVCQRSSKIKMAGLDQSHPFPATGSLLTEQQLTDTESIKHCPIIRGHGRVSPQVRPQHVSGVILQIWVINSLRFGQNSEETTFKTCLFLITRPIKLMSDKKEQEKNLLLPPLWRIFTPPPTTAMSKRPFVGISSMKCILGNRSMCFSA